MVKEPLKQMSSVKFNVNAFIPKAKQTSHGQHNQIPLTTSEQKSEDQVLKGRELIKSLLTSDESPPHSQKDSHSHKSGSHSDKYYESNTSMEAQQNSSGMNIIIDMSKVLAEKTPEDIKDQTSKKFEEIHKHNLAMSAIEEATDEETSKRGEPETVRKRLLGSKATSPIMSPIPGNTAVDLVPIHERPFSPTGRMFSPRIPERSPKSPIQNFTELHGIQSIQRSSSASRLQSPHQSQGHSQNQLTTSSADDEAPIRTSSMNRSPSRSRRESTKSNRPGSSTPRGGSDRERTSSSRRPSISRRLSRSASKTKDRGQGQESHHEKKSSHSGGKQSSEVSVQTWDRDLGLENDRSYLPTSGLGQGTTALSPTTSQNTHAHSMYPASQHNPAPKCAPANTITCPHCSNLIMIPFYTTENVGAWLNNQANHQNSQIGKQEAVSGLSLLHTGRIDHEAPGGNGSRNSYERTTTDTESNLSHLHHHQPYTKPLPKTTSMVSMQSNTTMHSSHTLRNPMGPPSHHSTPQRFKPLPAVPDQAATTQQQPSAQPIHSTPIRNDEATSYTNASANIFGHHILAPPRPGQSPRGSGGSDPLATSPPAIPQRLSYASKSSAQTSHNSSSIGPSASQVPANFNIPNDVFERGVQAVHNYDAPFGGMSAPNRAGRSTISWGGRSGVSF